MKQYLVRMKISGYYEKVVDADSVEEAKENAWDSGDFGDAHNIDGDFISCEELPND